MFYAGMNGAPLPAFQDVPNHPHARYRTYTDRNGQFWIECQCKRCGIHGNWRKPCMQPGMWQNRVLQYARLHGHGVQPRVG